MKLKIFAIYDDKACAYLPPFFLPTKNMAIRAFGDCANDPKHQFGSNPADYTLFELGEFDDTLGHITVGKTNRSHGTALDHKRENVNTEAVETATQLREIPS